ncbi:MAG TPA: imidazole glycerol phosphate synthase subunit HisH [Candidatus Angelobacter sp.]|jgi:glutamine amidotransferase|nr:imidazole glycerol phosphate synthase subunit HisH [Candidatus Angelobacter sp.]
MIAIVDYGAGNISSVKKALEHLGADAQVTSDPAVIATAEKLVVPGVGHFSRCQSLNANLRAPVLEAIVNGKPFLGICVGMQWLFAGSTEAPETPGAALFAGECSRFPAAVKSPHVGWNQIDVNNGSRLLKGVSNGAFVYYTHSFRAPVVAETIACTSYGGAFSAAVERDNVFGVQFHPEKSAETGLKIMENFCAL